jgi:acyl-CoA reductase-like NAD-dependent aldehyde dehydrogenase
MRNYQAYIDGNWCDASTGATVESIEPYSGQPWATVPDCGATEVDIAVRAAHRALRGDWRQVSPTARANLMLKLAHRIDSHAEEIAEVESRDNGKVYREMIGQARGLSQWYRHFAGYADKITGSTIAADKPDFHIYTRREPIGVVGAITAWNSPLLLLAYKLAPALAAGCTFVVKPSELASASTLLFANLVQESGFPPGVFSVITGGRWLPTPSSTKSPSLDPRPSAGGWGWRQPSTSPPRPLNSAASRPTSSSKTPHSTRP